MLEIVIEASEQYDEVKQEFININDPIFLRLEHSLVSLSKWESKWHKPFFSKDEKTTEETIDYVRCMTLTQNVKPEVYYSLSDANLTKIYDYIDDPMTATTFSERKRETINREKITSELIYYWMIYLNIPSEYQKWHVNRLLTLIQVCNIKNSPSKKLSNDELASRNRALNDARRKKLNSKG